MVGNDYLKDIVPAKSVGMQTICFSFTDDGKA
jgi:FMN phosphatase YigB (HAD superfamily)